MVSIPLTTSELVSQLDTLFPQLKITPTTTMQEIQFNAGQRELIAKLKIWWEYTLNKDEGETDHVL